MMRSYVKDTFFGHADLQTSLVAALTTDVAFSRPDLTFGVLIAFVWFCSQQTPMKKALLRNESQSCTCRVTAMVHGVHVYDVYVHNSILRTIFLSTWFWLHK